MEEMEKSSILFKICLVAMVAAISLCYRFCASAEETENASGAKTHMTEVLGVDASMTAEASLTVGTSMKADASVSAETSVTTEAEKEVTQTGYASVCIEDFPEVLQMPELPTGCEVTALTMVLNYYGFRVDKTTMAGEYLPKAEADIYYGEDGRRYGTDLNEYFIGDPFTSEGVICGTGAIVTAADAYLQEQDSTLRAKDITGTAPEELYRLVAQDIPVVVWVTISMEDRTETKGWYTEDGEYVDWSHNDHGAVLIGYTDTLVTIADPINGIVEYEREQFERVYRSRGMMSVILE